MPPKRKKSTRKRRVPVPTRSRDGLSVVERLNAPLASGLVITGRSGRKGSPRSRTGTGRRAATGGYTSIRTGTPPGQPYSLTAQAALAELKQSQMLNETNLQQQKLDADIAQKRDAFFLKQRTQALKEEESRFKRDLQAHKQRMSDEEKIIKLQEKRARDQVRPMDVFKESPGVASKGKGKTTATQTPSIAGRSISTQTPPVAAKPGKTTATQTPSIAGRSISTQTPPAQIPAPVRPTTVPTSQKRPLIEEDDEEEWIENEFSTPRGRKRMRGRNYTRNAALNNLEYLLG